MSLSSIFSFTRENSKSARGNSLDPRHRTLFFSYLGQSRPFTLATLFAPLLSFLFFSRAVFTLRVNNDAPLPPSRDFDEDGGCVLRIRFTKMCSVDRVELFTWPRTGGAWRGWHEFSRVWQVALLFVGTFKLRWTSGVNLAEVLDRFNFMLTRWMCRRCWESF